MREAVSVRGYRDDDFDALFALIDACSAPEPTITRSRLRSLLSAPGYQPRSDLVVAPSRDGAGLRGVRDVRFTARGDEDVPILESWGHVHPDAPFRDTADALLRTALARAKQLLTEHGRPHGIVQARCGKGDTESLAAFDTAGLKYTRDLVTMLRRSLDDIEEPAFPAGCTLRAYRNGEDDAVWVHGFNEAFADHWGGFMGMSPERWAHERGEMRFRPEISLVAWDGPRLAGFCHCLIDDELNALRGRRIGVIRYVGVIPAWRRKGLGAALTRTGLRALRDAGMEAIALGVDAENVTGARRLYESYGFEVVAEQVIYRGGVAAADPLIFPDSEPQQSWGT